MTNYAVFFVRNGQWVMHLQSFSRACCETEASYLRDMLGLNAQVFSQPTQKEESQMSTFKLTATNSRQFAMAMAAIAFDKATGEQYFARTISAMHRSASAKQQQAIVEEIQRLKMTHTIRELANGTLVSAFETGLGQ